MYLDLLNEQSQMYTTLQKMGKKANTFSSWLRYYRNHLLEATEKLFTWNCGDVPQKEIEMRLIILGKCGINPVKGELTACDINLSGITKYYDEWTTYDWVTPIESGKCKIGVDGVLVNNNALRNPTMSIINRYAMMLAHVEVSLSSALVNGRSNVAFIAKTQSQADSIRKYRDLLYEGKQDSIMDQQMLDVNTKDMATTQQISVLDLAELRTELTHAFYKELGIPVVNVKKERMITSEVEFENILPRLNIENALEQRQEACKEVNRIFGANWSVKCNVPYEYEAPEEPKKGDDENAQD